MPNSAIEPPPLRRKTLRVLLAAALTGCSAAPWAQQVPPAALETVTVTGSRLGTAGAGTASVIGPSRIETLHKPDLPELLASVAGLHTNQPGGRGSVGEIILRGGEPNFTTVLVDGVQVNDPTNTRGGSFDLSTLALEEIERIEILRGPISSIYGSDALSGLINIVTRAPTDRLRLP